MTEAVYKSRTASCSNNFSNSLPKKSPDNLRSSLRKSRGGSLCGRRVPAYCGWARFGLAEAVRLDRGAVSHPPQRKGAVTT